MTSGKIISGGIGLLVLALALGLLWFYDYTNQPGIASHKIIVATEKMRNSLFDKAVILVLEQDSSDAVGLALNRSPQNQSEPRSGGPIEPDVYYTIHSLDLSAKDTVQIADLDIGYTKGDTFLLLIKRMGDKPQEHITFKGSTGWGDGLLSSQIADGEWKIVNPSEALIFHTKPDQMWDAAMKLPEVKQE